MDGTVDEPVIKCNRPGTLQIYHVGLKKRKLISIFSKYVEIGIYITVFTINLKVWYM